MGVLRWRSRLDDEIAPASSQPLPKLDLEILIALRLAVYQFRWLDRVPQRAALHESVELVKRARKRSAAPFVNAVLRKLSDHFRCSPVPPAVSPSSAQSLAAAYRPSRMARGALDRTNTDFPQPNKSAITTNRFQPQPSACARPTLKANSLQKESLSSPEVS